jgi:hypothetical protein
MPVFLSLYDLSACDGQEIRYYWKRWLSLYACVAFSAIGPREVALFGVAMSLTALPSYSVSSSDRRRIQPVYSRYSGNRIWVLTAVVSCSAYGA